jgi:hypothetical protein
MVLSTHLRDQLTRERGIYVDEVCDSRVWCKRECRDALIDMSLRCETLQKVPGKMATTAD